MDQWSQQKTANAADWAMAEQIRFMLTTNRTLATAPIAATVKGSTVTLQGSVPTQKERDKVHAAVAALPGVDKVDDQIQIKTSAGPWKVGESQTY